MPGDLSSPEFLFPFYYDPRYAPGRDPFGTIPTHLEEYLQGMARAQRGYALNKSEMQTLKDHLFKQNLLQRNPGDEAFREAVTSFLKKIRSARKVVQALCRI